MNIRRASILSLCIVLAAACSERGEYRKPVPLSTDSAAADTADSVLSLRDSTDTLAIPDSIPAVEEAQSAQPDTTVITHRVRITTSIGRLECGLYGLDAPKTVENFVKLAGRRYYRRMPFHRVAKNFIVQTGNPLMKKSREHEKWYRGGESSFGEPFADELDPESASFQQGYKRGTIAMANRGPNSNTSQFFICLRDLPELPMEYTIFGRVLKGMDLVDSIAGAEIEAIRSETDGMPLDPVTIKSIRVRKLRY